jgi:hypothetical protein
MEQGVDLIGKPDFYLLDISGGGRMLRFCHWLGYGKGTRQQEPIGIGRILSKKIMEKMDWQPIAVDLNNSIDYSMYQNVLKLDGKCALIRDSSIQSLSISTDQWANKHKFNDHYSNRLPSSRVPDFGKWLEQHFPEHKLIFNNEQI